MAWKHHLLSLFDRLIEEVDKSTYYIGLLSRYRIRSHIYTARSDEVAQILGDKGKAMTDGLSNIRFAAPNRPLIHRQRLGTGHGFLKVCSPCLFILQSFTHNLSPPCILRMP